MEGTNSTDVLNCVQTRLGISFIIVICIILPFHVLMIKVLLIDLRLALPRHMITLSLSISDFLQIFVSFLCMGIMLIFNLRRAVGACDILRFIMFFNFAMTLVVSSLSLIALSLERYVACIHCFRLHEIFTRNRTILGISFIWIVGVIAGIATVAIATKSKYKLILDGNYLMKILAVVIAFPTIFLLACIQYRLLAFSRSKLRRVNPGTMTGSELEMADMRKKQMKISFVASIVVLAYVISMLPVGCLSLVELINGNISSPNISAFLKGLSIVNNFADPYIYGLGTVDTRKAILKNLKRIKNFFVRQ